MCAITRSGQVVEDWARRLRCLNVKRDFLKAGARGEEVMKGCEEDMAVERGSWWDAPSFPPDRAPET